MNEEIQGSWKVKSRRKILCWLQASSELKYINQKGLVCCGFGLFALKADVDIAGEALILSFKFTRNAVSF